MIAPPRGPRPRPRPKNPLGDDGFCEVERQLLVLLSKGFRMPEAADRLGVNRHTMADHLARILGKLNASTQAEAVYQAVKAGVIP